MAARAACVALLSVIAFVATLSTYAYGYRISYEASSLSSGNQDFGDLIGREKRAVENLDEYPTAPTDESQEEAGFWDRVVKVALKLFSRFIEWLNS